MNDTPVPSSRIGNTPDPADYARGAGYVDPLAKLPTSSSGFEPQELMPVNMPSQKEAIHSFSTQEQRATKQEDSQGEPVPQSLSEMQSAHESAPEIPPQVVEAGVEHSPEISQEKELQKQISQATADLQQSAAVVPQPIQASGKGETVFPMSKLEAEETIKTEPVDSGRRWKATEILKWIQSYFVTQSAEPL